MTGDSRQNNSFVVGEIASSMIEIDSVIPEYLSISDSKYILDSNVLVEMSKSHQKRDASSTKQLSDRLMRSIRNQSSSEPKFQICEEHRLEVLSKYRDSANRYLKNQKIIQEYITPLRAVVRENEGKKKNRLYWTEIEKRIRSILPSDDLYNQITLGTELELEFYFEFLGYIHRIQRSKDSFNSVAVAFSYMIGEVTGGRLPTTAKNDGICFFELSELALDDFHQGQSAYSFITNDNSFAFWNRLVGCFGKIPCVPSKKFDFLLFGFEFQSTFSTRAYANSVFSVLQNNFERLIGVSFKEHALLYLFLSDPANSKKLYDQIRKAEDNPAANKRFLECADILGIDTEYCKTTYAQCIEVTKSVTQNVAQLDDKYRTFASVLKVSRETANEENLGKGIVEQSHTIINSSLKSIKLGRPLSDVEVEVSNAIAYIVGDGKARLKSKFISKLQRAGVRINDKWLTAMLEIANKQINKSYYFPPAIQILGDDPLKKLHVDEKNEADLLQDIFNDGNYRYPEVEAGQTAYLLSLIGRHSEAKSYCDEANELIEQVNSPIKIDAHSELNRELLVLSAHIDRALNLNLSEIAIADAQDKVVRSKKFNHRDLGQSELFSMSYEFAVNLDRHIAFYEENGGSFDEYDSKSTIHSLEGLSTEIHKYTIEIADMELDLKNNVLFKLSLLQALVCQFWTQLILSKLKKPETPGVEFNYFRAVEDLIQSIELDAIFKNFEESSILHIIKACLEQCDRIGSTYVPVTHLPMEDLRNLYAADTIPPGYKYILHRHLDKNVE